MRGQGTWGIRMVPPLTTTSGSLVSRQKDEQCDSSPSTITPFRDSLLFVPCFSYFSEHIYIYTSNLEKEAMLKCKAKKASGSLGHVGTPRMAKELDTQCLKRGSNHRGKASNAQGLSFRSLSFPKKCGFGSSLDLFY